MSRDFSQDDPGPKVRLTREEREILASFVERAGADAVVVVYSTVKRNRTASRVAAWGNFHAIRGLLEWADELINDDEDEEKPAESDDEEDDEEDEEDSKES